MTVATTRQAGPNSSDSDPRSGNPPRSGSDFAELSRRVRQAGLLRPRGGHYAVRAGALGFLLAGTWAGFAALGDSWWQLLIAVALAVLFGQTALLAHDIAHRQVFRTRRRSELAGRLAGNLAIGLSYGWWQDKHSRHHANPNHEERDPDVSPDILVWSTEQAARSSGVARYLARYQAYAFFPLLTVEGFNLHVSSVRALRRRWMRHRGWEATLLLAHIGCYLAALFLMLSPGKALAFLAIHQGLWGIYLGCAFAPNHKGMPTLSGTERPDFLRRQVLTSRNVAGGRVLDSALGGLNHQIEHHLFPSMPTPNLRHAQPIVQRYCAELGVPYTETGLIDSYAQALRHMYDVGAPLRAR